jgi:protoporphyrinogen oxidase
MVLDKKLNSSNEFENVIIGAGPAGLTVGFELSRNMRDVLILESDREYVGGIARTVSYKGFKFDIGGHRFFTKSEKVKELWKDLLEPQHWKYGVPRLSRIYFERKFFSYPLKAFDTLFKLGIAKSIFYVSSYLYYKVFPIKNVKSFEEWVTNNFGKQLYLAFFKTYTEKVWGIPCNEISADWAAQRIKGLSLIEAIKNALSGLIPKRKTKKGKVIKTLIENFDYPKYGPGMLWESAAIKIKNLGGQVLMESKVTTIHLENSKIQYCEVNDGEKTFYGKNFVSTLPIKKLISILEPPVPNEVLSAGNQLKYRDFLTVVIVLNQKEVFPDNWIYIHEPNVKLGRIQNFKNWSEDMVPNASQTSLGLEYFCLEGDELWSMADKDLISFGLNELVKIGIATTESFLDGTVVRMPKAYPVYDEGYKENLAVIKEWLGENIFNLQLVGRNGMHMYNNQDHSMLSAYYAARNLLGEKWDPWLVNADAEYHEEDTKTQAGRMVPKRLGS